MRLAILAAPISALFMMMVLPGCVTINIYFPASAAEKAADKIIDDIWQGRGEGSTAVTPSTPPIGNGKANDEAEKPR